MGRWSRKRMLNDNGWFFLCLRKKGRAPRPGQYVLNSTIYRSMRTWKKIVCLCSPEILERKLKFRCDLARSEKTEWRKKWSSSSS